MDYTDCYKVAKYSQYGIVLFLVYWQVVEASLSDLQSTLLQSSQGSTERRNDVWLKNKTN
jgi:hypothetical protein